MINEHCNTPHIEALDSQFLINLFYITSFVILTEEIIRILYDP